MQVSRILIAIVAAGAGVSHADVVTSSASTPDTLDLRLSLSSFLYREMGSDAPALVEQGTPVESASPVRRYFGDLRLELSGDGVAIDARVRQTTSLRFQSGAAGGSEYELRGLSYRLGGSSTSLTIGRQHIDAAGATKIDGIAAHRKLVPALGVTLFGGLFPALGSRSLDTDYPRVRGADGSEGEAIVPITGGLAAGYQTERYHGGLGVVGIVVRQDVPNATTEEASRVFVTSTGYWRPRSFIDLYHFALLDVAGQNPGALTSGSAGLDLRPLENVQLTASVNHVGIDVLQIATRNLLVDPDPSAIGIVQNDLAVIRVSQDVARGGMTVSLAQQRFELSLSGGLHRRPAVSVPLADGMSSVVFPEARAADATFTILDRRSIGGLRLSLTGSVTTPLGDSVPNRARGTIARIAAGRLFASDRGQLELDVMGGRFTNAGASATCMTSFDVFACYSSGKTLVAQAGVLASWRAGREWLVIADVHLGYRDARTVSINGPIAWPDVYTLTSFVRVQWRYR